MVIKAKRYFINFLWKINFDTKIAGWMGQDFSVHMTLSVERIDVWLTPNVTKLMKSWTNFIFQRLSPIFATSYDVSILVNDM